MKKVKTLLYILLMVCLAAFFLCGCGTLRSEFYRGETDYLYNQGCSSYKAGEYEKAFEYYQRVVKLDPEYAQAYGGLGNLALIKKKYDDAQRCYKKAIELDYKLKKKLLPLMLSAMEQKVRQPLIECGLDLKKVLELLSADKEKELERLLTKNVPIDLLSKDTVSITLKERDKLNKLITDYAYSGKGSTRLRLFIGYFLFYSEERDWLAANVLSNTVKDIPETDQQDAYMKLGKLYERMGQEDRAVIAYLKATNAGLPMAEVAPYLARIYGVPLEDIMSDLPSATATPDEKQDKSHSSVSATGLSSSTIGK